MRRRNFRIVHLVDNPAAAAAAKRAAAKKEEGVAGGVDPATLHARLKERFREHPNWFRDAVYLLTGFKVDMQGLGEGQPAWCGCGRCSPSGKTIRLLFRLERRRRQFISDALRGSVR